MIVRTMGASVLNPRMEMMISVLFFVVFMKIAVGYPAAIILHLGF